MILRSSKLQNSQTTPEVDSSDMADGKQTISLAMLRSELQASREAVLCDIKTEMANMRQEIKRDITTLREETKAELLWTELQSWNSHYIHWQRRIKSCRRNV